MAAYDPDRTSRPVRSKLIILRVKDSFCRVVPRNLRTILGPVERRLDLIVRREGHRV